MQVRVPVRRDRQCEGGSGRGDTQELGHASHHASVRLQDVGAAQLDELAELPPGAGDLAGRDRRPASLAEPGVPADVVGRERLLEPPQSGIARGVLEGAKRGLASATDR